MCDISCKIWLNEILGAVNLRNYIFLIYLLNSLLSKGLSNNHRRTPTQPKQCLIIFRRELTLPWYSLISSLLCLFMCHFILIMKLTYISFSSLFKPSNVFHKVHWRSFNEAHLYDCMHCFIWSIVKCSFSDFFFLKQCS